MKKALFAAILAAITSTTLTAADIYVDYNTGKRGNTGTKDSPFANFQTAIGKAKPGDTIYILPSATPIRDTISVRNISGTPDKPITVDGMNNIFLGTNPLNPKEWKEVQPGLFCKKIRTGRNWTSRYYMTVNGKINRMGRVQKASGGSAAYKDVAALAPGEWTIVRGAEIPGKYAHKQYHFEIFVKLPAGATTLADSGIEEPNIRKPSGVLLTKSCENLVFRNMIVKNFYNDGYNIHGKCYNIHFENIAAVYCGDDAISAHEACTITVKNLVAIGCSTAICHVNEAKCAHENVYAEKINGRELFFTAKSCNDVKNFYAVASSYSGCAWHPRKSGNVQNGIIENIYIVNESPTAKFEIDSKPRGEVNTVFKNVQLAGFKSVTARDGVNPDADAKVLREKIANAKAELFKIFNGNLEKSLQ